LRAVEHAPVIPLMEARTNFNRQQLALSTTTAVQACLIAFAGFAICPAGEARGGFAIYGRGRRNVRTMKMVWSYNGQGMLGMKGESVLYQCH